MNETDTENEKQDDEKLEGEIEKLLISLAPESMASNPKKLRAVALFGEVYEEKLPAIVLPLLVLKDLDTQTIYVDPEDPESEVKEIITKPLDFYISSYGGSAVEMFSIYDVMRLVREECELRTIGLGKIMSAGV